MTIPYQAQATAAGGRTGSAKSSDGRIAVTLDTVKEIGGAGGVGSNLEQLFAAGYSACFRGALEYFAVQQGEALRGDYRLRHGRYRAGEDGKGFGLDIALSVTVPGSSAPSPRIWSRMPTRLPLFASRAQRCCRPPRPRVILSD